MVNMYFAMDVELSDNVCVNHGEHVVRKVKCSGAISYITWFILINWLICLTHLM